MTGEMYLELPSKNWIQSMSDKKWWTRPRRVWPINLTGSLVLMISMLACRPVGLIEATSTTMKNYPVDTPKKIEQAISLNSTYLPPSWEIIQDDFESGTLDKWEQISKSDLSFAEGGGTQKTTGLSVEVSKHASYLQKNTIIRPREGYLTFWINPIDLRFSNQPSAWTPGQSVRVANVKGTGKYHILVGLRVYRASNQGFKAYLEWQANNETRLDDESGAFDLVNGWQKITIGYRANDWAAVWLNENQVRKVSGITHDEDSGEIIQLGNTNDSTSEAVSGRLRFDEVIFQAVRIDDLWVDAIQGNDNQDGLTSATALRTIQKAADQAGPGTKVHVLPGVYRESIRPAMSGTKTEAVLYTAEAGPKTAVILGSESSQNLSWTQLDGNTIGLPQGVDPRKIYFTDLSAWKLNETPRFIVERDERGEVAARLPLAREPDWTVNTEWKTHEFWWAAEGGSKIADCDPGTNTDPDCDFNSRSTTQLTDSSNDSEPAGIEPGNLTTLGDLTGATLVAIDTRQGHYVYRRIITAHNLTSGQITVDRICEHDEGSKDPGLGWGTKYYVEDKASLLDTPGEWWYDKTNGRLYLWPSSPENPAKLNLEISRQEMGFTLSNRSYITLEGLKLELFNGSAVYEYNEAGDQSYSNTVRNATLRYAKHGLYLFQNVDDTTVNITDGFTLEHSEIGYMDNDAIYQTYTWKNESKPASFSHAGVINTVIRENELHHLGFRTDRDNAIGVLFEYPDKLRFEENHVHHVSHNGAQFSWSIIQSPKEYGFTANEIKTGDILVKDNVFEQACQLTTDCGALKFWGDPPNGHVFRDVLITGNVFRNTYGWTSIAEKRKRWEGGPSSDVHGMGGFGFYADMASGLSVYRNIAYNNAYAGFMVYGVWRDGDMVFYNNVAANSLYGFLLSGLSFDTHGSVNTQLVNNILANNEGYGIWYTDSIGFSNDTMIDHNLYFNNGWRFHENGGLPQPGDMVLMWGQNANLYYPTLSDIQTQTPWEVNGQTGDAKFLTYNPDDHIRNDSSWPDFHITTASKNALDQGTVYLPDYLTRLLGKLGVEDHRFGTAIDIGRYEAAGVLSEPGSQSIAPGETAQFSLKIYPFDFPDPLDIAVTSPSPDLTLNLSSSVLTPGMTVTLSATSPLPTGNPVTSSDIKYPITITATSAESAQTTNIQVTVRGKTTK
jgi:hypothetical protein